MRLTSAKHNKCHAERLRKQVDLLNTESISEVLIYLGAIGIVQFASLAFSARQLQGVASVRLRRRVSSVVVRHAPPFAAVSAAALLAGVMLRL
jgi:hypothetical protein